MIRFSENSLNQTKMKKVEKMNWKIISIILVVILAAVAVSGCIGSPETAVMIQRTRLPHISSNITSFQAIISLKAKQGLLAGMADLYTRLFLENAWEETHLQTARKFFQAESIT